MKIIPLVYSHISYNKIQPRLNPSFGCSSYESNPYTEKAFDIAKKLLIQMKEEVIPVKEMGKIADVQTKTIFPFSSSSTSAYTEFKRDFNTGKITHYPVIAVPLATSQEKIAKAIYVMNFAHELTHKYQIDDEVDPQSQLIKDTLEAGFKLREIGRDFIHFTDYHCCQIEGDIMRKVVWSILGEEGKENYIQTGGLVLTNSVVNESLIAKALGYKDEKEFIENFVKENVPFDEIVETICTRNPIIASKCVDSPTQIKLKIKKILVKYCRNIFKMEKEARLTENKIAKLQGYDDKVSKCNGLYYSMVEQSFDYYLNKM